MTKNNTCRVHSDVWGVNNPRDIRLQIYISLTLGVGAFLTFCASLCTAPQHGIVLTKPAVPPAAMEGPVCCTQEAERPRDSPPRAPR